MENCNFEEEIKLKFDLSDKELEDIKLFLKGVQSESVDNKNGEMAVKFLRAKKFNVEAALDLYQRHETIRTKENLLEINPFDKDILNELLSQKFTFLTDIDSKSGASICIFTARLHHPSKASHQHVLKALIFQLDAIILLPSTQKNGLIFIYNMTGSLYSNFDMTLSVKILNLLKGAYPARLCKVIIFTPPLWFRAAFNFLRLFVKDKLQDRVWILTKNEDLHCHLTKEILPISLGGCKNHSHKSWLRKAFNSLGYSYETLDQKMNNFRYNNDLLLKDSPSNDITTISDDVSFLSNNCENGHSVFQEFDEPNDRDLVDTNIICNEILSKIDEDETNHPTMIVHNKSVTSESSREISFDTALSPTVEIIDHVTISNNPGHSSPTSTSSGFGSCVLDNKESDYDMLSISSWELNLITSGDEDAIEEEDHRDKHQQSTESNNGTKTIENSPNVECSSARTPFKILEKPSFFQKVQLKRRNAVREDYKTSDKKPNWALYRPEPVRSLHNALSVDSDLIEDNDADKGVTIEFFYESELHSFYATLAEFRTETIYGEMPQFTSYSNPLNVPKNRYSDIPCIESSRVKLVRDINCNGILSEGEFPSLRPTDYIHANWVDGYRQINAYICTQGPLSTTVSDFWHMIIQYRVPIIVMTTRPKEQNREKCYQYWPEVTRETKIIQGINSLYDNFQITSLRSKEFGPNCPAEGVCDNVSAHWYRVTLLHIKNLRTGQEHRVNHFYFHSWPDQGIPNSSEGFLHFITQIRQTYRLNIAKLGYESEMDQKIPPPPIVVHCSAGIGRTGTYIVTEICTKSLTDCGRFNLHQAMLKIRSQRYKCVQNAYQYLFCRNTIIDYAKFMGYLSCQTGVSEEVEQSEEEEEEEEEVEEIDEIDEIVEEIDEMDEITENETGDVISDPTKSSCE